MTNTKCVSFNTGNYGNENLLIQDVIIRNTEEPGIKLKIEFFVKNYEDNKKNYKKYTDCFLNQEEAEELLDIIDKEKGELKLLDDNTKITIMPSSFQERLYGKEMNIIPGTLINIERFNEDKTFPATTICNAATIDMIYHYIYSWLDALREKEKEEESKAEKIDV